MAFRAALFFSYGQSVALLERRPGAPPAARDYFVAGAMTGAVAALAESPVDFFKSQMQVQIVRARSQAGYQPEFKGVADVAVQAVRLNGIRGPFQGLSGTIIRNVPANAMYFGSFEWMRGLVAQRAGCSVEELSPAVAFACGGTAGALHHAFRASLPSC